MSAEELFKAFPNGIPPEVLDRADYIARLKENAKSRISEINEHLAELQERIDDIQDWLDGKTEVCPDLHWDSDWDSYPNG